MSGDERRETVPAGYKMTEVGVIPEDWEAAILDSRIDVLDGDRGNAYPSSNDFRRDDHCLFLNAGNVTEEGFKFTDCSFISQEKDDHLGEGKLHRYDVVLTTRGTVGNTAYFNDDVPFSSIRINSGMVLLRCRSTALESSFLYHLLRSSVFTLQVERFTFGSAQPQLTVRGIKGFRLVIPPRPEQHAIAEVLSDVDNLLDALDRLIAKKRAVKQAAMQQLLTGKTRLPGFAGEWEETTLGEVATTYGGLTGKTKDDFGHGESRYISFLSVLENADIDDSTPTERVEVAQSETQNAVRRGDVLFNGTSETPQDLAMGSAVQTDTSGLYLNSFCFGLRPKHDAAFDSQYIAYYFRSSPGRDLMSSLAQGATRYNMSKAQFLALRFGLPPLPEQRAIAAVLSDMDDEIAALEKRCDKTRRIKDGMMQQLLTGRVRLLKSEEKECERA